jgi:hypothetical protein
MNCACEELDVIDAAAIREHVEHVAAEWDGPIDVGDVVAVALLELGVN